MQLGSSTGEPVAMINQFLALSKLTNYPSTLEHLKQLILESFKIWLPLWVNIAVFKFKEGAECIKCPTGVRGDQTIHEMDRYDHGVDVFS